MITMFSSTTLCTCETIFIGIEGKIVMLCYLYDEIQNNKKKNNKIGIIITTYIRDDRICNKPVLCSQFHIHAKPYC